MKIILLATAQTKECFPLTVNKPNALLKIFNKTLLEYALTTISDYSKNVTVVILRQYFHLFDSINILKLHRLEIIDDLSEIERITENADLVLDVLNYYPNVDSIDKMKTESFEIKYAWDLLSCHEKYIDIIECTQEGEIEPYSIVKGKVSIGKGTIIKSGVYIEGSILIGQNCIIGPNCYIRGTTAIGDNCRIGNAVEIKSSIIGNNVNICHLSYLGDSIVGDNANLGAGFINSNLRHDSAPIITKLNGEKIDTCKLKLGAIIGDGVHTGINTSIYPGRKIWPNLVTLPGTIVDKDIEF